MNTTTHLHRWLLVLGCLALVAGPALAAPDLRVTEAWPGNPTNLTVDWFEITNLGTTAWTSAVGPQLFYDDSSFNPGEAIVISGLTDIQPNESVVIIIGSSDVTAFRTAWQGAIDLTGVEVGYTTSGANLGIGGDGVGIWLGGPVGAPTHQISFTAIANGASWDADLNAVSVAANASGAVLSPTGNVVASPGRTASGIPNPNAPTVSVAAASRTRFNLPELIGGDVSGVISDPTDPAATVGIEFTLSDPNSAASTLTLGAVSSNQSVVPNANLVITGSGASRTLQITPTGVGTATVVVTANDPQGNTKKYTINYAASGASSSPMTSRYHTGASDGSTAIEVNGLMVVGNDEDQVIRVYQRQQSGLPVAAYDFTANLAGAAEADLEASLRVGNRIYWLGSHGNSRTGVVQPSRQVCFSTNVDPNTAALTYVNRYNGMRADLIAWDNANGHGLGAAALGFAAGSAAGVTATDPNGFNIEGATVTANGQVYLAFRAPLRAVAPQSSRALLVPVTNFQAVVDSGVGPMTFGAPVFLNLFGAAIRSISKNQFDEFLILAGAVDEPPPAFSFFLWDGNPANAPTSLSGMLDSIATNSAGSPEAIVNFDGKLFDGATVDVLVDNGSTIHYANGVESKDVAPNWRKFRSDTVSFSGLPVLTVTTTVDENNGLTSGAGASLREAIGAAQDGAIINFAPGLDGLTLTLGNELVVDASVTIDATALSSGLTVSGGNARRVFSVNSGQSVKLRGLTLSGGNGNGATEPGNGGAIHNRGSLELTNCTVTANAAQRGAGILNGTGATLTLDRCTVSQNQASVDGGGLFNFNGTATLTQCTVVGNTTAFDGAGIYTLPSSRTTITHCTIAGNASGAGSNDEGGGIQIRGEVFLTNSIVAGNTAVLGPDLQADGGLLVRSGVNLIGNLAGSGLSSGPDLIVGSATLAPLGHYGGRTRTMPPLLTSPALDAATTVAGLTTDQRGLPRSVDGDANGAATPDIGAAERTPGDPGTPVVTSTFDEFDGTGTNGTSLREALFLTAPGGTVVFDSAFTRLRIVLSAELVLAKDVVIDGSSVPDGFTIDGGPGTNRIFSVNSAATVTLRSLTLTGGNGGGATNSDQGGAIINFGNLTLERCTLHSNSALSRGGAISNNSLIGSLTMMQCTLTNNSAGFGGAIHNFVTTSLTHCTLSGNTATSRGGGVFTEDQPSGDVLNLTNCVVAQNNAPLGPDVSRADASVTTNASGVNFIGNPGDSGLTAGPTILTGNALLAALAHNGGPTHTMALLPASPARNAATVLAPALTGDQRGFPIAGLPDLGAYERGFNTFAEWSQARLGSVVSFTGDSDNDSHRNGLEYATRTSPTAWNPSPVTLPVSVVVFSELMRFSFPYQPDAIDLRYIVQRSPDLVTWTEIYRADLTNGQSTVVGFVSANADPITQTIILEDPDFLTPRCFWRLVVEKP